MAQFEFVAQNTEGQKITGVLKADGRESALKALSDKQLLVTKLLPVKAKEGFLGLTFQRVSAEEILLFTQELAALLDGGINMLHAMEVIGNDIDNPRFKGIIHEISTDLSSGHQLSVSLKKFPESFSRLYVSLVEAGEASGTLPRILARLAGYLENAETLRRKVKAALVYPLVVVSFALMVLTFIFIFGIPRLKSIYAGLNVNLPLLTQILISIGNFISHYFFEILLAIIVGGYAIFAFARTEKGQLYFDGLKLTSPIIGSLFQKLSIARFSSTLSTLYASGVPIIQAFGVVAGSIGNRVLERAVLSALNNIREGQSIVEPLRNSGVFTSLAISMISAGEESGTLEKMLSKVADFYESQVDIAIKGLSGLIEPVVMIIVGVFIGLIILSVALPFMTIGTLIH